MNPLIYPRVQLEERDEEEEEEDEAGCKSWQRDAKTTIRRWYVNHLIMNNVISAGR